MSSATAPRTVISFGHLHASPPRADVTFNVSDFLRDPARVDGLLDHDGFHPEVKHVVRTTPGAATLVALVVQLVTGWPADRTCTVAIGCQGGKHRGPALAELVGTLLATLGQLVAIEHRDVHRPRVLI
jgi:UPF0042 nucleotide-binding protein